MDDTAPVYGHYDQRSLDAEYNNRGKTPDVEVFKTAQLEASNQARRAPDLRRDIAFGPSADERVDVFPATGAEPGPVHVFFHGGYWKQNHKDDFGFVANPFQAAGAAVVVVEYALIPTVEMGELVRQCRAAMAWVWKNAASFGGDASRIHVSGHSAGGHLTTMMMATDWPAFETGLPADLVKSGCAISGIYDLEPIRLCFMNAELSFTPEQVAGYSPVLLEPKGGGKLLLPVGAMEGPEFIRQSADIAAAWSAKGIDARAWVMPGHHHFSIINQYIDPKSELSVAARQQMGL